MADRIPQYRPKNEIPTYRPPASDDARQRRAFLSTARWRRLRAFHIAHNPLCADCLAEGRTTPATDVHHIVKRSVDPHAEMDRDNLVSLCRACHSTRTGRGE